MPGSMNTATQPISISQRRRSQHWWFDRHQTGVYNSAPPSPHYGPNSVSVFSSSSSSFSGSPARNDGMDSMKGSYDDSGLIVRIVHKIENIWDNSR